MHNTMASPLTTHLFAIPYAVDATMALAIVAARHDLVRPEVQVGHRQLDSGRTAHIVTRTHAYQVSLVLTVTSAARQNSNAIIVQQGRHLLQEQVVEQFVPNDTAIGCNGQTCAIVTGPNFSGKSVYLKQVCAGMSRFH